MSLYVLVLHINSMKYHVCVCEVLYASSFDLLALFDTNSFVSIFVQQFETRGGGLFYTRLKSSDQRVFQAIEISAKVTF